MKILIYIAATIWVIFDILIPRFKTEAWCLLTCEEDKTSQLAFPAELYGSGAEEEYEHDSWAVIRYFQLFGFIIGPKIVPTEEENENDLQR